MIINRVKLHIFAGVKGSEIELSDGLNVILGPNEAGKSTFIKALYCNLLFPVQMRKNSKEYKELQRCFPYPDGDTISTAVEFTCDGKKYALKKAWGSSPEISLTLPDGSRVEDHKKVEKYMKELLRFGRATYGNILMAKQSELVDTVERVLEEQEARSSVSEVLRSAVFQSDGVSVDKLRDEINEELNKLTSRWDMEKDCPENNRGIDNPYKQGVGEILGAYYDMESARRNAEEALKAEENYIRIKDELENMQKRLETLEADTGTMKKIEGDIQKRRELEPKIERIEFEEKRVQEVNEEWPEKRGEKKILENNFKSLEARKDSLLEERKRAAEVQQARQKREKYNKVKPIYEDMKEREKELKEKKDVPGEAVKRLQELEKSVKRREMALEAGKLKAKVFVKKPLEVDITRGLKYSERKELNGEYEFEADGRFVLSAEDLSLEVRSGEINFEDLSSKFLQEKREIDGLLAKYSFSTVREAEEAYEERKKASGELENLKQRLKDQLGEEKTFAELEEEVKHLPAEEEVRSEESIQKDIDAVNQEFAECRERLNHIRERIDGWEKEYGDYGNVSRRLVELQGEREKVKNELDQLAGLPGGYGDPQQFLDKLSEQEGELSELKDKIGSVRIELVGAESGLPEESHEVQFERVREKEKMFERYKKRADTLVRLKREFEELVEEEESSTYEPLQNSFIRYIKPLTNENYVEADMDGVVPKKIRGESGRELPVDLLSMGTNVGIVLALRLAAAEHLFGDVPGFIVMDDPLVNLDPDRKKMAAKILKDYAEKNQLIITTCDPELPQMLQVPAEEISN